LPSIRPSPSSTEPRPLVSVLRFFLHCPLLMSGLDPPPCGCVFFRFTSSGAFLPPLFLVPDLPRPVKHLFPRDWVLCFSQTLFRSSTSALSLNLFRTCLSMETPCSVLFPSLDGPTLVPFFRSKLSRARTISPPPPPPGHQARAFFPPLLQDRLF